ncbi:MAG: NirD/YgiW/YdeI family stress tolerance protein [Spirochaetaceae bacterium]|nr:NirD/YgiW/YdeI family stress tolerance protein [Spirochaetaceae bacterium]
MKMRKGVSVCLAALVISAAAWAQQGGYRGPGGSAAAVAVSVAEAKKLRDHAPVILRGNIERFLGDEKYLFADASGKIVIEIDDKLWAGISVDEKDTVEITGEIDKDFKGIEVDVERIRKL